MDVQLEAESPAAPNGTAGLCLVRDLLECHPNAAVAVVDFARNIRNARELLAGSGIDIGLHTMLRGTVAAEFIAATDAGLVSAALIDARRDGVGTRAVHLRDGRDADLHLIRVDELHLPTSFVMVIVPGANGALDETPTPNTVEAATRVGLFYADGSGIATRAEDSLLSVLGRQRTDVEGHPVISFVHPDEVEAAVVHWVAAKEQRGVAHRWRCRLVRGDGSLVWTEVTLTNRIDDGGDGNVRVEIHDISGEVAAAEALAVERSLLKQLTESLPVGVAKFNADGRIEYANAQLANLLGRDPAEVIAAAIRGEIPILADAFALVLRDGRASRFIGEHGPEPTGRDLEWTLRPVTSETGAVAGGVLCVADVTEATALRAALEERATTDALTGCLNWAGTIDCLSQELAAATPRAGVGLLFIDLDGFKGINDGHGHAVGDRVLEIVARRLRNAVRPLDRIGRLGGDEFVVVSPGLASLADADALAARASDEVNGVATVAGLRVEISASVGVAWADSGDPDVLLAEADRAMYAAKCAQSRQA
jgi:diguanylate cyclase (GGDEF)-like protein/PAS domain S-box-containing protein